VNRIKKKTIIAGSRDINDYNVLLEAVKCIRWKIGNVVSGTCRGVDKLGEQYAKQMNVYVTRFPADWDKYGSVAGRIRNKEMAQNSEALLAIWDGKSPGTKHMIEVANEMKLDVYVYRTDKEINPIQF